MGEVISFDYLSFYRGRKMFSDGHPPPKRDGSDTADKVWLGYMAQRAMAIYGLIKGA